MKEGTVVIVATGQCGTIVAIASAIYGAIVLLRNGEMWQGPLAMCHEPQSAEEMESAPLEVEKEKPKKRRRYEAE